MKYVRDNVQAPVSEEYFSRRRSQGWQLRAIEWEQEDASKEGEGAETVETVPYGLQIVSGSLTLTQNPAEMAVLLTILEMIVRDKSVPLISDELNRRKLKTRHGTSWTAPAVFDLLPRVIEMGPSLLRSREWISLRPAMTPA